MQHALLRLRIHRFHANGIPVPDAAWAESLEPLRAEGFYRVESRFDCCEKKCRTFEPMSLVQLGYDGAGEAILFVPEWSAAGFVLPERGSRVTQDRLSGLTPLRVAGTSAGEDQLVH